MISNMKAPIEPNRDDCCNSGCNPCIFDVYERQLKKYHAYKESNELMNIKENGISQLEYTAFRVCEIIELNATQRIIRFKKSNAASHTRIWWKAGDHFIIKYKNSEYQSSRAYTPIKLNKNLCEDFDFMIVLKKYSAGLVSKYLFSLQRGHETLWRGPYGHYNIELNKYSRIVMIAQGTGVAPFISIIDEILSNDEDMTKIALYYCCKTINDILLRDELYEFKSYWNFKYHIYLSYISCEGHDKLKYKEPIIERKLSVNDLVDLKPQQNDQFLICGSHQFMEEYKAYLKNKLLLENIILF